MPISIRLASLALALTTSACTGGFRLGGTSGSSVGPSGSPGSGTASSGSSDSSGSSGSQGSSSSSGGSTVQSAPAATKFSDFAFEVKDATGEYYTGWVIDKLTTFNVSPSCMEKMLDHNNGAIHGATFYTRDIAELAKVLTGDDWSRIESQNNSDRETNKKLVEPMIDRFKEAFSMSITVDGDDCDAKMSSLWIKYWTSIGEAIKKNPPASGKVHVQLAVRGDARDVKVEIDDATSTYTITAPRDIEKGGWDDKIEKPFRKHARQK